MHPPEALLDALHPAIWIAWLAYWKVSARGVKAKAREETAPQRYTHYGPIIAAVFLFCAPNLVPGLREPVFHQGYATFILGTAVLLAGLLFTVWARVVLGRNWSATVAVKQDHELVRSGPYHLVRHPIYTGILTGFLGSAIAQDRWGSFLAVALVTAGFWFKLRREEAWMRETFGAAYETYCARTARLIPFVL
ncbi:MAG: isoprenylcysteine carboxylmethyltransferase family protein [Verrucomicrobiota bacterium]